MSKINTNLVRALVEKGRAKDLADLMEGESKYCTETPENTPASTDELYTYRMALEHVLFVAKFGLGKVTEKDGTHYYSAYPEYFEQWLASGCLGIVNADLMAYLADNPID